MLLENEPVHKLKSNNKFREIKSKTRNEFSQVGKEKNNLNYLLFLFFDTTEQQEQQEQQRADLTMSSSGKTEKQAKYKPQQGIVYGVPSGDTLSIVPAGETAKHEFTLYISGIQAPRINHAYPQTKGAAEEPFAWASREFLRKKCIGRRVTYTIQSVVEGSSNPMRAHGTVKLGDEDVAGAIISEGWATVRISAQGKVRPETEALLDLQERAIALKKGIYSASKANAVRPDTSKITGIGFFDSLGSSSKDNSGSCGGVVERIHSGNALKICFAPPSFYTAVVSLAGVVAPGVRWDAAKGALTETEPGGLRAYDFLYAHVLHRDAKVALLGCDKFDALFGRVNVLGRDLGIELVKMGFAKTAEWAIAQVPDPAYRAALLAAQDQAVKAHAGMWKDGPQHQSTITTTTSSSSTSSVPQKTSSVSNSDEFEGVVVDIPTPGVVVVEHEDGKKKEQQRLMLASIRVPKMFREKRDPTRKELIDNMFAMNGRAALRSSIFGRKVLCKRRYDRPPQGKSSGNAAAATISGDSSFWDVYIGGANVAVELVKKGLAEVVLHKAGEPRSNEYGELCMAEKRAQAAKTGLFAPADKVEVKRVNDLTLDQSHMHSEAFLPFLRNMRGEAKCTVEYVFSGSRLKVYIPAQNCMISVCLAGVTVPRQGQKHADEALAFMRRLVHMRDLKASAFDMVDKGGNFIATLSYKGENLSVTLVKNGYAQISDSGHRSLAASALEAAEKAAQAARLHIWEGWSPEEDGERENESTASTADEAAAAAASKPKEIADIVVSDPGNYTTFFIQNVKDLDVADELAERIAYAMEEPEYQQLARFAAMPPKAAGEMFLAYFADDDMWYRARSLPRNSPLAEAAPAAKGTATGTGTTLVQYVDYGTVARVPKSDMKPLPKGYEVTPQIALRAALAYVLLPRPGDEYFDEFADYFDGITADKPVKAVVEYVDSGTHFVTLLDAKNNNINYDIVKNGLARLAKDKKTKAAVADPAVRALREAENFARKNRKGMWSYGDIDSDPEN